MQKLLKFEKDIDGRWYVVLPEWPEEERDSLEMVCGADIMCDILAQGDNVLYRVVSDTVLPNSTVILKKGWDTPTSGGATYTTIWNQDLYKVTNFEVWLCDVTKHVFGEMPDKIYIL